MASYTKGPWEVEKSQASSTGSVHYAVKTMYKPVEHPHSPRFIVFMCGGLGDFHPSRAMNDYRSDPNIEADAHLIAAAPDLFEALKEMVSDSAFAELCQGIGEDPKWLKMGRAAIAKAEGQGVSL
jgi:hypothetical protein